MASIEYAVSGQTIRTTAMNEELVSGTIGFYTVEFTFDSSWDTFEEIWAVFDPNPGPPRKNPVSGGIAEIPGEVMGGTFLRIGVFGLANGVQYPTVWANQLRLREGCYVEVPPSDWPEPSPLMVDVVRVTEQDFSAAEQEQARENIGAVGNAELAEKMDKPTEATAGNIAIFDDNRNIADSGKSLADIYDSAMISKTVSGDIVTIEDGANVPVKTMTIGIEPVQAGSGVPSPSNVRAISGWTGASLIRAGRNLLRNTVEEASRQGVTMMRNPDGSYRISGVATAVITAYLNMVGSAGISLPYGQYTVSINSDFAGTGTSTYRMYFEFHNISTDTWNGVVLYAGQTSRTVRCDGIRNFRPQIYETNALDFTIYPQIEVGTVAHEFESYMEQTETYPITFPSEAGTVYGGSLTINEDGTGVLTKEWALLAPQSSWMTAMGYRDGYPGVYISIPSSLRPDYNADGTRLNVISEIAPTAYVYSQNSPGIFVNNATQFGLRLTAEDLAEYGTITDGASGLSAIKSYNAVNQIFVLYKRATPMTYTLTAPQVQLLQGLNNIWADTGSIESLTYRADPTMAIAEQTKAIKESIAPVEEGFTASQAYAVNDPFYVGDDFYYATATIASGATITPGTNCIKSTETAWVKHLI